MLFCSLKNNYQSSFLTFLANVYVYLDFLYFSMAMYFCPYFCVVKTSLNFYTSFHSLLTSKFLVNLIFSPFCLLKWVQNASLGLGAGSGGINGMWHYRTVVCQTHFIPIHSTHHQEDKRNTVWRDGKQSLMLTRADGQELTSLQLFCNPKL